MNTVQAFTRNVGTYGLLLREIAKQGNCEAQSTNTAIGADQPVGIS